jgi:hypothetical protein
MLTIPLTIPERLASLDRAHAAGHAVRRCRRAIAVRESRTHTKHPPALVAIDGVLVLLDRAAAGGEVGEAEWAAVEAAAEAAAWSAAAWPAAGEAAWGAAWAAAAGAAATTGAAGVARAAARTAAADRMASAMLTAIEDAITEKQDISTC